MNTHIPLLMYKMKLNPQHGRRLYKRFWQVLTRAGLCQIFVMAQRNFKYPVVAVWHSISVSQTELPYSGSFLLPIHFFRCESNVFLPSTFTQAQALLATFLGLRISFTLLSSCCFNYPKRRIPLCLSQVLC